MDRENHMTIIPVGETLGEAGNCGNNADHNFPMGRIFLMYILIVVESFSFRLPIPSFPFKQHHNY